MVCRLGARVLLLLLIVSGEEGSMKLHEQSGMLAPLIIVVALSRHGLDSTLESGTPVRRWLVR